VRDGNMPKKIKLTVNLIDKGKIFPIKAEYDPLTRIAYGKERFAKTQCAFKIDPNHIYEHMGLRRKTWVFVDNATRESITIPKVKTIIEDGQKTTTTIKQTVEANPSVQIHNDDPIDLKEAMKLNLLIHKAFWEGMLAKRKIPLKTTIIYLLAGVGIYSFIVLILRIFGVNV
jgi:hypothetical protein